MEEEGGRRAQCWPGRSKQLFTPLPKLLILSKNMVIQAEISRLTVSTDTTENFHRVESHYD